MTTSYLSTPMLDALGASAPEKSAAGNLGLYDRLIGSWRIQARFDFHDGSSAQAEGEVHVGWVLEGRAIQDLFIIPARDLRANEAPQPWWRYGSTFRWYDPAIDAWHTTFFDPARSVEMRLLGRAVGEEIVHMGEDQAGLLRRWRFTNITDSSFTWIGHVSWDKGESWTQELRMDATRSD